MVNIPIYGKGRDDMSAQQIYHNMFANEKIDSNEPIKNSEIFHEDFEISFKEFKHLIEDFPKFCYVNFTFLSTLLVNFVKKFEKEFSTLNDMECNTLSVFLGRMAYRTLVRPYLNWRNERFEEIEICEKVSLAYKNILQAISNSGLEYDFAKDVYKIWIKPYKRRHEHNNQISSRISFFSHEKVKPT